MTLLDRSRESLSEPYRTIAWRWMAAKESEKPDVVVEGEDRLRVELDGGQRQRAVLDRHDHAVVALRGDGDHDRPIWSSG